MKTKVKLSNVLNKMDGAFADSVIKEVKQAGLDPDKVDVIRKFWASEVDEEESIVKAGVKLEEGSRTAIKYVSTRSVDLIGDVVMPKGISFKAYKKRGMPVFWMHDYSKPQIGRDETIKADDWGVKAKMKYADTGDGTLANILWNLSSQDMNKESSVGLVPLEVINEEDADFKPALKTLAREWPEFRKNMKNCRRIIAKSIFLEHSDVSFGLNPDTDTMAVSKAYKEAGASNELLKKLGLPTVEEEADDGETNVVDAEQTIEKEAVVEGTVEKGQESVGEVEEVSEVEVADEVADEVTKSAEKDKYIRPYKPTKLISPPRIIKLISPPPVEIGDLIDKSVIKEAISAEIRRIKGKLI